MAIQALSQPAGPRPVETALSNVRLKKDAVESYRAAVNDYVQWHKDNPSLAKPRVMILHREGKPEK